MLFSSFPSPPKIDPPLPRGYLGVRLPPPLRLRGPLARGGGPARRHGLRPQEEPRPSVGLVRGADRAVPRPQIRRKLDHVRGTHCVKVQAVQNLPPPSISHLSKGHRLARHPLAGAYSLPARGHRDPVQHSDHPPGPVQHRGLLQDQEDELASTAAVFS